MREHAEQGRNSIDELQVKRSAPKKKFKRMRGAVFAVMCIAVCASMAVHIGIGSISAWGWDMVELMCPLGALEALVTGRELVPRLIIGAVVALALALVFGKAFCSWACPVPRIRRAVAPKGQRDRERLQGVEAASRTMARWQEGQRPSTRKKIDSRHFVLIGAIASSFVCGFPVFCLICPVGLTFGTVVLVWRLVQFNQWSWAIVLFPLIVVIEVVVLKKWCGSICPIGALLSLAARGNRTFVFQVDDKACRRRQGDSCSACTSVCPEHVDIVDDFGDRPVSECVKCGRCADACPMRAIEAKIVGGRKR